MAHIRKVVFPMIHSEGAFLQILPEFLRFFHFFANFSCPDFAL